MALIRLLWRVPFLTIHIFIGLFLVLLLNLVLGRHWYSFSVGAGIRQLWLRLVLFILGVRVRSSGEAADNPVLLVANHISWVDVLVISSQKPSLFVAKSDLRHWPIIGLLAKASGTIFVQRESKVELLRVNEQLSHFLQRGGAVSFFPEGTSTDGRGLNRFKSSLYESAFSACSNVQALALNYTRERRAFAFIDDDSFLPHLLNLLTKPPATVELSFCKPLVAPHSMSRKEMAVFTQGQIQQVLDKKSSLYEQGDELDNPELVS